MRKDKVTVRNFETVSGVNKQYKDIKPKYCSNFNKITKIHSVHRIYCEDFSWSDIDEDLIPTDVLQELILLKVLDGVHKRRCHTFII